MVRREILRQEEVNLLMKQRCLLVVFKLARCVLMLLKMLHQACPFIGCEVGGFDLF